MNPLWKHFYLDSTGLCVAWHYPPIDGLNGLRPTLRVGALHLKSSTVWPRPDALAPTASFRESLKALSRASFQELRQFLPRPKAEAVIAALSMSAIAETEHARSKQLDNPESIYRACADMKLFNQEVLRVILLDTR